MYEWKKKKYRNIRYGNIVDYTPDTNETSLSKIMFIEGHSKRLKS